MEDDSSTAANNQEAEEQQTGSDAAEDGAADTGNNSDTSKSTDSSADADNKSDEGKDDASASQFDADLDDWAVKSGRSAPTTDGERALLQELRNNSREFTREQQAKKANKAFEETTTSAKPTNDEDEELDELEEIKLGLKEERARRMRSEFFNSNGITMEQTVAMGEILKEKTDKGGKTAFDFWSDPDNLQDLYDLAKVRLSKTQDNSAIADEAARAERERIAKESKANGSARNATSTSTGDKSEDEARLERFSNWD